MTAETFGRDILGPIVAEFCFRLWSLASLIAEPDTTALLFCARGGLRLQLAYDHLLAASGLPAPVHSTSFMVSRLVAARPAVLAGTAAARSTLAYEFSGRTLVGAAKAITGVDPGEDSALSRDAAYSFDGLQSLLSHPDGGAAAAALAEQAVLFKQHLVAQLAGRRRAILVDTGLYGSTMQLLSSSERAIEFSCAMMARSNYRGDASAHFVRTFGLLLETDGYKPWDRRSVLLRYWHLIESALEPDLPSVKRFTADGDDPRSNLEVVGWRDRVEAEPGSIFAGVLSYIDALPRGPAVTIMTDAKVAWRRLHRAIVWPNDRTGIDLDVGPRGHDFGFDDASAARPWNGPLAALRGHSFWREGEIARSGSVLRLPLLAAIEGAYGIRSLKRALVRRPPSRE